MDPANLDLVRGLCTRIGAIMEDASVIALVWSDNDELQLTERLARLEEAGRAISTLVEAAKIISQAERN